MSQKVLLGILGAFNCFRMKPKDVVDLVGDCYDGASIFLLHNNTQVPKHPLHPWYFDSNANVFRMNNPVNRKNEEYYDWFEEYATLFAKNRLKLEFCFFDQYFTIDNKQFNAFKFHPFRDNDVNINFGGNGSDGNVSDGAYQCKRLYDSQTFSPAAYNWETWETINEPKLLWKFKPVNKFGECLEEYFHEIAIRLKRVIDLFPVKHRFAWRLGNECVGKIDPVTGNPSANKSYGDTSMIHVMVDNIFSEHGVVRTNKFQAICNRDITGGTAQQAAYHRNQMHVSITRAYGVLGGLGAIHEVHIKNAQMRLDYIADSKFVDANTNWDTDSNDLKDSAQTYINGHKELIASGAPNIVVLFEEGGRVGAESFWGGTVAPYWKYDINLARFIGGHNKIMLP